MAHDDVTSLIASLHISETQLRRRCRTAIGLAPKALHRMLRFQGFLALVQQAIAQGRAPTDDGLALLALRAGYADQPHLTRECVRLTGVSPRVFLAETQQACACGHDHSASFAPMLRAETADAPHTHITHSSGRIARVAKRPGQDGCVGLGSCSQSALPQWWLPLPYRPRSLTVVVAPVRAPSYVNPEVTT